MQSRRNYFIYGLLTALWLAICIWQFIEFRNGRENSRDMLLLRADEITTSLGVMTRAQGRFTRVSRSRLEASLDELAKSTDIIGVELLDLSGNKEIAAGEPLEYNIEDLSEKGRLWGRDTLLVANVVELGSTADTNPSSDTLRNPPPSGGPLNFQSRWAEDLIKKMRMINQKGDHELLLREIATSITLIASKRPGGRDESRRPEERRGEQGRKDGERPKGSTPGFQGQIRHPDGMRRGGPPPWLQMSKEEFDKFFLTLDGGFNLVLKMKADYTNATIVRDMWARFALVAIALVAVLGLAAAWMSAGRSFGLEVRLARAQEMNVGLREMNLAAAGLAHETRNPLNLVRGKAQMVVKELPESSQIRSKAQEIIEEVDRVASRLNEFIDYSKPREAKLAPMALKSLVLELADTLESDMEDNRIEFSMEGLELTILADESLFRQMIFNLLLNAFQAVEEGGKVSVVAEVGPGREATLKILDDGGGVPAESRERIFQPYYTTRPKGTGLGLSIVRQIVLAHRWEIACKPREEGGTAFIIKGLNVV